jgi:hypothetical protein
VVTRLAIAAFLLAHAAIHAGFVSPRPPATAGGPPWPFDTARSWALTGVGLDAGLGRSIAVALVAVTFVAFAVAELTALGFLPTALWAAAVTLGAIASVAVLVLFFHPWLVVGVAIDVALLWAVLVQQWFPATT